MTQELYVSGELKTGRVMVKDEDVCLHCGLCAERCPTGAWDMQRFLLDVAQAENACCKHVDRVEAPPAGQRLRRQVRQRQRVGFGQRQHAVRQVGPAHGRAGDAAQHLPLQHPGPADLVRGAHLAKPGTRRARRRRRPDGRDEPADLGPGRRLDRAGRLPVLRLDQADAGVEVPRRHQRARRAADRDEQQGLHRSAAAPVVQEHRLSRRAVRAARHGRARRSRRCWPSSSRAATS